MPPLMSNTNINFHQKPSYEETASRHDNLKTLRHDKKEFDKKEHLEFVTKTKLEF